MYYSVLSEAIDLANTEVEKATNTKKKVHSLYKNNLLHFTTFCCYA